MLMPQIKRILSSADVELRDLTDLAVNLGPGLFTGLRVGIATAEALARNLRLTTLGLSGTEVLHAVARQAGHVGVQVVAVVDVRRSEVAYSFSGQAPKIVTPKQLATTIGANSQVSMIGDGAQRYRELWPKNVQVLDLGYSPLVMAQMALADNPADSAYQGNVLKPLYLRGVDARANFEVVVPGDRSNLGSP